MRVPTVTDCPSCPGVKLQFDTDSQAYDCGNGHAFADLPEVHAPAITAAVAAPVLSESRTVAPVLEVKPVEVGRSLPAPPSRVAEVVADPVLATSGVCDVGARVVVDPPAAAVAPVGADQSAKNGASSVVASSVSAALPHGDQNAVPGCVSPAPLRGPELAALLAAQPPVRCENGDWLVVVRFAEMDALTLIGEAEGQRKTFADYVQRAINYALSNDWLRNAGN